MKLEKEKSQHLAKLVSRAFHVTKAVLEERLQATRTFCMLSRLYPHHGHLRQPAFLQVVVGPLLPSKKMVFTNEGLVDAVNLWCSTPEHRAVAEARYGHISFWNTSKVTNMEYLFRIKYTFNDDISKWDTSKVTTMECMFWNAHAFNGDLSRWDTSNVITMKGMFCDANAFNGDLSRWNTSNVTDMGYMFYEARVFNGDLHAWDTSNVTNMGYMFCEARAFNGDISAWNTSNVTYMGYMFCEALNFNSEIGSWDVSNVTIMVRMFFRRNIYFATDDNSTQTTNPESFSGDIHTWDVSRCYNMIQFLYNCPIANYKKPHAYIVNYENGEECFESDLSVQIDY